MGQGIYPHPYGNKSSHYKHGLCNTRLYRIWGNMKNRCSNLKSNRAHIYLVRGIKVCDEWRNDFQAFYDWAISHGYSDELTLDRINNDGNYEPNNCRWVTYSQQNKNRRNIRFIEYKGEKKLLSEWAKKLGIKQKTLWMRLYFYNWPIEKAFATKVR